MTSDYFAGDARTNRERMLAGDLYIADDPENARRAQRAVRLAAAHHRAAVEDEGAARPILAELAGSPGEETLVKPPLYVDYGENLVIGARTFVNYNLTALDVAPITIGADCQIGPNVQLLTPTHPIEPQPRRDKLEAAKPITIGDNVWLGGGVIVCPGVTIGENSVIGAGAVVTRDFPPMWWSSAARRVSSARSEVGMVAARARPRPAVGSRRPDPQRRDRIIDVCLDLIAESGVVGVSHRKVAAAADVPLGSMTYHFSGMDQLLREAFARFARTVGERFERRMAEASDSDEAAQAVAAIIVQDVFGDRRELVLTQELYTLAAREPAFRDITNFWMARSRRALERHFDSDTARILDALIEGLTLHRALDTEEPDPATITDAIHRVTRGQEGG